jgi:membrane-bound ClpP family serine protease
VDFRRGGLFGCYFAITLALLLPYGTSNDIRPEVLAVRIEGPITSSTAELMGEVLQAAET